MKHIVFFDLETSGFDPMKNDIIQIAAAAVNKNFEIVEEFEVKVDFDPATAEAEALEVNNFDAGTWAMKAVKPYKAIKGFCDFLNKYKSVQKVSKRTNRPYMVAKLAGHNTEGFDRDFLFKWSKRVTPNQFIPADWFTIDTLQMQIAKDSISAFKSSENVFKPKSMKLSNLIDFDGAHDALADVRANVELAKALFKKHESLT